MNNISPVQFTKHIYFRLVHDSDAEFILSLRTDEIKSKHLSYVSNEIESQRQWLLAYKQRESLNQEYYFIISKDGFQDPLGTVRLYDFKENSFCWGSWIIVDSAPTYTGIESALTVYRIGFEILSFKNSHFDVRKSNKKVIAFHMRFGANIIREDEESFYFEINKKQYLKTEEKYARFLIN